MDVSSRTVSCFTTRQLCDQSGLSVEHIRKLIQAGLIRPQKTSVSKFSRNLYSFQDLAVVNQFAHLLKNGATFNAIRSAYQRALEASSEQIDHPSAIRLLKDGEYFDDGLLLARDDDLVDAHTGERVFNFTTEFEAMRINDRVRTIESLKVAHRKMTNMCSSEDWFVYGLDCEDADEVGEAIKAYEHAIGIDPRNADAWVNLGRIHFASGRQLDSRNCYEEALRINEFHEIAHYNLGILFHLFEAVDMAVKHLKRADTIPEAAYSLARIYRKLGDTARAIKYKKKYRALREDLNGLG